MRREYNGKGNERERWKKETKMERVNKRRKSEKG